MHRSKLTQSFLFSTRLCLGLPDLQAEHGRGSLDRHGLLQQDRLPLRLLADHDGLHLSRPLHLLHLLLQHRLSHPQERILIRILQSDENETVSF